MPKINSHCSYCGERYAPDALWPRCCRACGNTSYLNPLPVVVVLLPLGSSLLVIRRNIEPQKGTLTLPGGYLELGESWQQGACRELKEETGIGINEGEIELYDVENGLDQTLVIFGLAHPQAADLFRPFSSSETQELVLIKKPIELGFSMHTRAVRRYFTQRQKNSIGSQLGKK